MADDEEVPPQPQWEGAYDEEGLPHGKGKMQYPAPPMGEEDEEEKPGDAYEGEMSHGKRHGKGKYIFGGNFVGGIYEGDYVDNKKHGKGKFVFPDKSVYTGDFKEDKMDGQGLYAYANGDMYQGDFKEGKRHGSGMYHFKSVGCQMVGEWAEGGMTKGRWVYKDGSMFYGSFDKLQPYEGAYYFSSSNWIQQGSFASGTWSGKAPMVGKVEVLSSMVKS